MAWYRRITRLFITPTSLPHPSTHYQPFSSDNILSHALADVVRRCTRSLESAGELPSEMALPFAIAMLRGLGSSYTVALSRVGQGHLLQQYDIPTTQSSTVSISSSQRQLQPTHARPHPRASRGVGFRPPRVQTPPSRHLLFHLVHLLHLAQHLFLHLVHLLPLALYLLVIHLLPLALYLLPSPSTSSSTTSPTSS